MNYVINCFHYKFILLGVFTTWSKLAVQIAGKNHASGFAGPGT